MIKRIIVSLLLINIATFASEFNASEYSSFKDNSVNLKESDFKKESNSKFNINEVMKNNQTKFDPIKQLEFTKNLYTGTDFLTKDEFSELSTDISNSVEVLSGPHEFILYFYSESVPKSTISNILEDLYSLQKAGIKILTKQYMFGLPGDSQKYFMGWKDYSDNLGDNKKKALVYNFAYKTDSRFFKMYEIKQVPAIALATCASILPDPASCQIKYLMHGDAPLVTFFDKISKIETSYKKYSDILNMNLLNQNEVKLK